jgi:hypothetical protein
LTAGIAGSKIGRKSEVIFSITILAGNLSPYPTDSKLTPSKTAEPLVIWRQRAYNTRINEQEFFGDG